MLWSKPELSLRTETWTKPNNSELVKRFFDVQTEHSVDDDWICRIEEDKSTFGSDLSENEIKVMKKEIFMKTVKEKLQSRALEFFTKSDLKTYKLQTYLTTEELIT